MKKFNIYKFILLLTALWQLVSPSLSHFTGQLSPEELLIVPAGYTFSIWGIITSFSFVFAFYHFVFDKKVFDKNIYVSLSFVYILFYLWLYLADRDFLIATCVVLAMMFLTLLNAMLKTYKTVNLSKANWMEKIFFLPNVAIYFTWTSIATFINIGTAFKFYGMGNYGFVPMAIQAALLLGAFATVIYILRKFKYNIFIFATAAWAFVGAGVGLWYRPGTDMLLILNAVLVAALIFIFTKNYERQA